MAAKAFEHVRMLLIDNYDSFTYNLVQAFAAHGAEVMVYRNDMISTAESLALNPTHLVISPGPGRPEGAGRHGLDPAPVELERKPGHRPARHLSSASGYHASRSSPIR